MPLTEAHRAVLDALTVDELWEYLAAREGCAQGRWWLHGLAQDGQLVKRRFELDDVKHGEPGPVGAAGRLA